MKNKIPIERQTLSVVETAAYLGVHPETIYEMVRKKSIPHIRVTSRIIFRVESLEKWMDDEEKRSVEVS